MGTINNFPIGLIMEKSLTLRSGPTPCQRLFPTVLKHLMSGELDPMLMVSHRIKMEDVPTAYSKLLNKDDGFIKVLVETGADMQSFNYNKGESLKECCATGRTGKHTASCSENCCATGYTGTHAANCRTQGGSGFQDKERMGFSQQQEKGYIKDAAYTGSNVNKQTASGQKLV